MARAQPSLPNGTDRAVLPWRVIAGAFPHFALPAYLIVGLAGCAAGLLDGISAAALADRFQPAGGTKPARGRPRRQRQSRCVG